MALCSAASRKICALQQNCAIRARTQLTAACPPNYCAMSRLLKVGGNQCLRRLLSVLDSLPVRKPNPDANVRLALAFPQQKKFAALWMENLDKESMVF
jgi:hypothetical protein